ncbi:formate dehydrogenase [Helicobacter cetorum]|uniref:formate dehydrogenase n=1 Tax=Helicobacter cetorum TaxID=138563 RepID=UPI000CF023A3|nr:formate dehydrogenase [Helicobacter cetorum]
MQVDENIFKARALYYRLWHYLVSFIEEEKDFLILQELVNHLSLFSFDEISQNAWQDLKTTLNFESFKNEQNLVLFSPSYNLVPLSASFYIDKQENALSRLKAIEILKLSQLEITSPLIKQKISEDDLSFLTLLMNALLFECINKDKKAYLLCERLFKELFHLFCDDFLQNLQTHPKSICYLSFASILRTFIKHERLFFNLH